MRKEKYLAAAVTALVLVLGMMGCSGSGGGSQEAAGGVETTAEATVETKDEEEDTAGTKEESSSENTDEEEEKETEAVETEKESEEVSQAEAPKEPPHSGFLFQSGDVTIGMNEDVAFALSGLGEYSNYAESPSCAFKGLDKIYSYSGFDLYTYPIESTDYVNSIYFLDDSVSTPEGIHLGSTVEDMLAAYGEDYEEEYGVYTYTKDKSTLSFIVTDGVIESIEYVAITE